MPKKKHLDAGFVRITSKKAEGEAPMGFHCDGSPLCKDTVEVAVEGVTRDGEKLNLVLHLPVYKANELAINLECWAVRSWYWDERSR